MVKQSVCVLAEETLTPERLYFCLGTLASKAIAGKRQQIQQLHPQRFTMVIMSASSAACAFGSCTKLTLGTIMQGKNIYCASTVLQVEAVAASL